MNEWPEIYEKLNNATGTSLGYLSDFRLAKLAAILDHWQKIVSGIQQQRRAKGTTDSGTD